MKTSKGSFGRCLIASLLGAVLVFSSPELSFAKGPKTPKPKPVKINITLLPSDPALTDLASAHGRVRYQSKKKNTQFKVDLNLPAVTVSLGITDPKLAQIHLTLSRDGAEYGHCTFGYDGNSDDDQAGDASLEYKLFLKTTGRRVVKGSCTEGLPTVQVGDKLVVSATVGGVEVPFLSN